MLHHVIEAAFLPRHHHHRELFLFFRWARFGGSLRCRLRLARAVRFAGQFGLQLFSIFSCVFNVFALVVLFVFVLLILLVLLVLLAVLIFIIFLRIIVLAFLYLPFRSSSSCGFHHGLPHTLQRHIPFGSILEGREMRRALDAWLVPLGGQERARVDAVEDPLRLHVLPRRHRRAGDLRPVHHLVRDGGVLRAERRHLPLPPHSPAAGEHQQLQRSDGGLPAAEDDALGEEGAQRGDLGRLRLVEHGGLLRRRRRLLALRLARLLRRLLRLPSLGRGVYLLDLPLQARRLGLGEACRRHRPRRGER
mmetsp:Transcript_16212/g.40878  ORF Transcript_16212/g.40878 Transcript_16212/m.40878 type:complete len:306 (-) Transcript_16212:915-1832(-)